MNITYLLIMYSLYLILNTNMKLLFLHRYIVVGNIFTFNVSSIKKCSRKINY